MKVELEICKNLVDAMVSYGLEACWCDSEIIDALIECGITEEDFVRCGYGDFVKNYFAECEE